MEKIRVSAKTLDEAITKAQIQLNTSYANMQYKVVVQGSNGLFGIGAKPWIIEAELKAEEPDFSSIKDLTNVSVRELLQEEKDAQRGAEGRKPERREKEPEHRTQQRAARGAEKSGVQGFAHQAASARQTEESAFTESAGQSGSGQSFGRPELLQPSEADSDSDGAFRDRDRERRYSEGRNGRERHRDRRRGGRDERVGESRQSDRAEREERAPKKPVSQEAAQQAEENAGSFLQSVLGGMGMQVELKASFDFSENELSITISGDDMGILIGKRGQTLDSLQYLSSLVVNKENKDEFIRVKLDTENYRNRREATLRNLARNIAYKVKRTRKPVSLEPMNPYERRIIHAALQNDRFVTTRSEGEEPFRHIVVFLKK